MQIWRNQNEKSSNEIKEEPSDRHANDHANAGQKPACGTMGGFERVQPPLKAARAEELPFMFRDAFSAEVVSAGWAAGRSFPIRVD
jgi:hypothetical protein